MCHVEGTAPAVLEILDDEAAVALVWRILAAQEVSTDSTLRDVTYDVTFAFAFRNLRPEGEITF